ncbi:MAG: DegT/DnrJ/EryC1/StrS aminotransferase family protein [bacterium]|nr:DegT/DnrJ/EryC1/StrS aminotransferase family protein [bacterium]
MLSKFKPISISLSPNVQKDDVALALKLLFQPWKWKHGNAVKELEDNFKKYLGVKYAFSFNSGRSSLYAILKAMNLPAGSDVALQAFTCNAVPNPILWAGLNPVYIDCADDFNIDTENLKAKSYNLKVLVAQHTFGLPTNMEEINSIVRQNGGIIIEDCAHALGAEINGKKVGTFGKAAFFSFSRDKVISCVYGGMAVTNDDELGKKLEALQKEFGTPGLFWIRQQILHPVLLHYIILPLYNFFDLGKIVLVASQWIHLLSKAVSWKEKRGERPGYFPKALPNALAIMAKHQLEKLGKFQEHRKTISQFYYENLKGTAFGLPSMSEGQSFLRFVITHSKAHEIIYEAWHNQNMLLGDWYTTPIAPDDTKLEEMKYEPGMAPNAERLAKQTLNLPTHVNISLIEAARIVNFLKKYK